MTLLQFFHPTPPPDSSPVISTSSDSNLEKKRKILELNEKDDDDNIKEENNSSIIRKKIDQQPEKPIPELLRLEYSQLDESWLRPLLPQLQKPYFLKLKEFLESERKQGKTIFPPSNCIYAWSRHCPLSKVRVVILGQDPYHNDRQAMGLCFSVPVGVAIPPSLLNIYKELQEDPNIVDPNGARFTPPNHGDLINWAKQGVLLLNTSLTVRAHEAASHANKGWEPFTDSIIELVYQRNKNVVFLLWGNHAQKKGLRIPKGKHLVLEAPHPSPLSVHRGFFGCHHFSKANAYLIEHGKSPINWNNL